MDHQKSNFSLILALFLLEAVEASRCYFFENWWMKLKCPLLLKPLATIVQKNSQSFYPLEPFRISHFTMRHPVFIGQIGQLICIFQFVPYSCQYGCHPLYQSFNLNSCENPVSEFIIVTAAAMHGRTPIPD